MYSVPYYVQIVPLYDNDRPSTAAVTQTARYKIKWREVISSASFHLFLLRGRDAQASAISTPNKRGPCVVIDKTHDLRMRKQANGTTSSEIRSKSLYSLRYAPCSAVDVPFARAHPEVVRCVNHCEGVSRGWGGVCNLTAAESWTMATSEVSK